MLEVVDETEDIVDSIDVLGAIRRSERAMPLLTLGGGMSVGESGGDSVAWFEFDLCALEAISDSRCRPFGVVRELAVEELYVFDGAFPPLPWRVCPEADDPSGFW